MRTRTVVGTVALAGSSLVVGCQIITQLDTLRVGTGGAGGASATSGASTGGPGPGGPGSGPGGGPPPCEVTCGSGEVCASNGMTCTTCGISDGGTCPQGSPTMKGCMHCDGGTCIVPCCPPSDMGLIAIPGPTQLECDAQCNQITVTCRGDYLCEVVCSNGGCQGLTLICSGGGPCRLTCHDTSCDGATVTCGRNECDLACDSSNPSHVVPQQGSYGPSCQVNNNCH